MIIKDLKKVNEEVIKETSKDVFLNMDEFFDKFYNEEDTIALLLITPKQALAAYADRNINHNDLYLKMLSMICKKSTLDINPIIQIKCSSKCNYGDKKTEVPALMVPFISDINNNNQNNDSNETYNVTKSEKRLIDKLCDIGLKHHLSFRGYMEDFNDKLKVCDEKDLKLKEENILGCKFKAEKAREDKEIIF